MPKTLNDIIPPSRRKAVADQMPMAPRNVPPPPPPPRPLARPPEGGRRFPYVFVIAALIVVALSVFSLFFFSKSKVVVVPSSFGGPVSASFSATPSVGDLPYEIITVEKTAVQSVPAETTETASDSARGSITITNTSGAKQEFVKNTRFETPSGLIFKAQEAVIIPAGTASAPGTARITVYAEAAGDRYNIGPATFTLPGLEGGELFSQVTARSEEAMEGGFSGERPSVRRETRESYYASMESALEADLKEALAAEVQEGYVFVPGASEIAFSPEPDVIEGAGTLSLRQQGTMTAVVFPNAALARAIAFEVIASYGGEEIRLEGTDSLTLAPEAGLPAAGSESFAFSLSGTIHLEWVVDPATIAGTVAGKSKDASGTLLLGLPEVEESRLIVRPFWTRLFPNDPEKIEVEVEETP